MLTLANLKASRISGAIGMCGTSASFLAVLNEALQRLMTRGLWWNTFQKMRLCVTDSCVTWPRQVANVEAVMVSGNPSPIRNQWYEFLVDKGWLVGAINSGYTYNGAFTPNWGKSQFEVSDKGTYPTTADIRGSGKKLKVYRQYAFDATKRILIQGIDDNGLVIRSIVGGEVIDGEYLTLSAASVTSTNYFSAITNVQKDLTDGNVSLYELNVATAGERLLATYEPDELLPSYRRTRITPSLSCTSSTCCPYTTVEAIVKLEFIPLRRDTDLSPISNLEAIKYECQAVMKDEADLTLEGELYHKKAIRALNQELRTYTGRDNVAVFTSINGTAPDICTQL